MLKSEKDNKSGAEMLRFMKGKINMLVNVFYNQYTNGGSVIREGWETFNADEKTMTYGNCYSLASAVIEISDRYRIGKDNEGNPVITDGDGYIVNLIGEYNPIRIKLSDTNYPFPVNAKVVK